MNPIQPVNTARGRRIMPIMQVLVVDPDPDSRAALAALMGEATIQFDLQLAGSIQEALLLAEGRTHDAIVSAYTLGEATAMDLMKYIAGPLILIYPPGDEAKAIQALRSGAYDCLVKDPERHYCSALPLVLSRTWRRKAEADELKMMAGAFQFVREAVVLWDAEDRILQVNDAFLSMYGFSLEAVLGRAWWEVLGLSSQKEVIPQGVHHRSDGGPFPVLCSRADLPGARGGGVAVIRDITDLRETERKQRRLLRAVEQNPAAICITDALANIRYINPKFCELAGYAPDEVLGKNPRILKSGVHGPEFYQQMWTRLAAGNLWRGQMCNRRKDGSVYWVSSVISPLLDERGTTTDYICVAEDISALRKADEEIRILARFPEENPNPVLRIDPVGTILYANASSGGLLEYWGTTVGGRIPDELRARAVGALSVSRNLEAEITIGDRLYQFLLSPIPEPAGLYLYATDISDRKRAERSKDEFVATVSHELRTPLTAIRGALGLLTAGVGGALDAEGRDLVETGLNNALRLGRLIDDLLDMSRIAAGRMVIASAPHDAVVLLQRAMDLLRPLADQSGVALHLRASSPGPVIEVDPDRFIQVITNLVSNALKFSPREGSVFIEEEHGDGSVRIRVMDQGPGVPEGFRSRLFERFAQVPEEAGNPRRGTGLGLAISRVLVERMKGSIEYVDSPGRGAVFQIELPSHSGIEGAPSGSGQRRIRLLHVGLDEEARSLLRQVLRSGDEILYAGNMGDALKELKTAAVDLVTLEGELAALGGSAAMRELTRAAPGVPAILIAPRMGGPPMEGGEDGWTVAEPSLQGLGDALQAVLRKPMRQTEEWEREIGEATAPAGGRGPGREGERQ